MPLEETPAKVSLRPVLHECRQCGACCRWPGPVRLAEEEINRLAVALGLTPEQFIADYTRLTTDRRGLTLIEQTGGACILLQESGGCRVHDVKPQQCRDFPLKWHFPGVEKCCPGILKME
jgi:Fe-S-cluster containining protein